MASVVVGNRVYVMGGLSDDSSGANGVQYFRCFEPGVGWTELSELPIGRGGSSAAVLGTKIYLAGGRSGNSGTVDNRVFVYDTATGGPWIEDPHAMVMVREFFALGAFDGSLYAVVGRGGGQTHDSIERTGP